MDLFAQRLRTKLTGATSAEHRARAVLDAVESVFAEIRLIEMMRDHYVLDAQKLVHASAYDVDLATRWKSAGGAVKDQEIVYDLEQSLNRLKSAQQKISAAIGS